MHNVHVFNPAAGAGRRFAAVRAAAERTGEPVFVTDCAGGAETLCEKLCREDPHVRIVVYGGDGTVHEAVNGILRSGHAGTASFSVVPAGSGNDFSAYVNGSAGFSPGVHAIDAVRVTDAAGNVRYFANSLNMGFDCDVVREADILKHKRGLSGSTAYIAGVVRVLLRKKPISLRLTLYDLRPFGADADLPWPVTVEEPALLCACANGPFCGGGFKGAPLCDMTDGYMDVLAVKNISRTRFVSMVGSYHEGTYIDGNGEMRKAFASILAYYRCRKAVLSSEAYYCLDGEVQNPAESVTVEVVPGALRYAAGYAETAREPLEVQ